MKNQPSRRQSWSLPVALSLAAAAILIACLAIGTLLVQPFLEGNQPIVTIHAPASGERITVGDEVLLVATGTGTQNIMRLEVHVDDTLVDIATSPNAKGSASLTARKRWTFSQPGAHVITVTAYTTREKASTPASIEVAVVGQATTPTPSPTPTVRASQTPQATASPVDTAKPTNTPAPTHTPTPTATPTATATNTPTPTPIPTDTLTPTPSATPTSALPNIEYFRINPETIAPGECALLEWGAVTNAYEAIIDQDIGGVATPGGMEVCPALTTSYLLTANGLGGTVTSTVTVAVITTTPNLTIESITFVPKPPVQGQDTEVRISIRNAGGGDAGPFSWEWQPGTESPIGGRLSDGLKASQTIVEIAVWRPSEAYDSLQTVARVDVGNEVAEANESDNELQENTEVTQSALGDLVLQEFYLHFDDRVVMRVSNPGGRIAAPTFDYQIFEDGVPAVLGSFDTPEIGSMVFWTDFVVTGERTIRVVIDPENLIAESDESNNAGTLTCSSASHSCW